MFQLVCKSCNMMLYSQVSIENLLAEISFKVNKNKLKAHIVQLIGHEPKFKTGSLYCLGCNKIPLTEEVVALCEIGRKLHVLAKLEYIAVKKPDSPKLLKGIIQRDTYSEDKIIKAFTEVKDSKIAWRIPLEIEWNLND